MTDINETANDFETTAYEKLKLQLAEHRRKTSAILMLDGSWVDVDTLDFPEESPILE